MSTQLHRRLLEPIALFELPVPARSSKSALVRNVSPKYRCIAISIGPSELGRIGSGESSTRSRGEE
jgi:hypothetical protein